MAKTLWRSIVRFRFVFLSCALVGIPAMFLYVNGNLKFLGPDPDDGPTGPKELPLPLKEREYLWEIEHHGNVLSQLGFSEISAALSQGDGQKLSRLLADRFQGHAPAQPEEVSYEQDLVQVSRRAAVGESFNALDRKQFVEELLAFRKIFSEPPKVKISLMLLSPTERYDLDSNWKGSCLLRMSGFWGNGKPAEVLLNLDFQVARPDTERIAAGGWLQACTFAQTQVGKAEKFLFRDVTLERGIDPSQFHDNWKSDRFTIQSGGVYLCDFNRDGLLDILIVDGVKESTIYLYQGVAGGKFRDVTTEVGLPRTLPTLSCAAWIDIDGDGWEDLVLFNKVYRNDRGRFVDYTDRCNLRLSSYASGAVVADYDRDGKMDLYVTFPGMPTGSSWLSGENGDWIHNHLYRNKGNWQFEDVTKKSGTSGGNRSSFSAAWLDANNDGWPDLYVINEFGDGVLLVNQQNGAFREQPMADHPVDFGSMGLAVGDLDNDGNIDLFVASMYSKAGKRVIGNLLPDAYPPEIMHKIQNFVKGNQLHRNLGGLKFDQLGAKLQVNASGWAYGPVLADLNNDGFLDIFSTAGFISKSRDDPDG